MVNYMGMGLFLDVQPRPDPKGVGLSASQFRGYILLMHTPFDAELSSLTTRVREMRESWGQPRLPSQESRVTK